jgi:PadR family transcriptional regulator, regulatory protein PadR
MTFIKRQDAESSRQSQLLKGLAELAVLSALRDGTEYGLSLVDRLRTEAGLDIAEGSIYPMLHRMEKAGSIEADWVLGDANARPRKYYRLTEAGRADLVLATEAWHRISGSLNIFINRSQHGE